MIQRVKYIDKWNKFNFGNTFNKEPSKYKLLLTVNYTGFDVLYFYTGNGEILCNSSVTNWDEKYKSLNVTEKDRKLFKILRELYKLKER